MLHNIFSGTVDGTPSKESESFDISGLIFNLYESVNLSHRDSTGEKPQLCLEKQSAGRAAIRFSAPQVHLGLIKKTSPKLHVKKLGKI